jgi:hypothetical protein
MQLVSQLTKKYRHYAKKVIDSFKISMVYLKVLRLWMIFEMMSSFEIHIICCIIFVEIVILRLLARMTYPLDSDASASARCVENSGVFASLSCLDRLITGRFSEFSHFIKSQFYSLTSMQNVSITKLFDPWIIYKRCVFNSSNWRERQCKFLSDWQQICCVFNKYLRKYYCGIKKYHCSIESC